MDFQKSSLVIEMPNSQASFGRNSANKLGSLLTSARPIIPKQMDKQKLLANVWKPIFVVSSLTSRTNGYSGYILQNGGITPPIIRPPK